MASLLADNLQAMLTEIYIEALLVDEELADLVWDLWDSGVIDNELAIIAWLLAATLLFPYFISPL